MDVRLDFGGETEEEDFEDEVLEGEVVEVAEEVPPESPVEAAPQRAMGPPPRQPKPGRKKALMVVAIIILVVVVSLVVYIYLPRPPTDIVLDTDHSTSGLVLIAYISSESSSVSSGTAEITITHNSSTVYENKNWKISSRSAMITIPWNEFVMDNGQYNLLVEFEGVSDETTYDVDFVLKHVTTTVFDVTLDGPAFTLRIGVSGEDNALPGNSEIQISSIIHENGIDSVTSGIGTWEDITNNAQHEETLSYSQSGNYIVTVDVKNNDVKDSSDYAEFSVETELLINAPPDADFTIDDSSPGGDGDGVVEKNEEVQFDGGISVDEGSLDYSWSITYSISEEDPGTIQHTGDQETTTFTFNNWGYYGVSLLVTDQHGEINSKNLLIAIQP